MSQSVVQPGVEVGQVPCSCFDDRLQWGRKKYGADDEDDQRFFL